MENNENLNNTKHIEKIYVDKVINLLKNTKKYLILVYIISISYFYIVFQYIFVFLLVITRIITQKVLIQIANFFLRLA